MTAEVHLKTTDQAFGIDARRRGFTIFRCGCTPCNKGVRRCEDLARRGNDIVLAFDVALFTFNLPYAILTLLVPGFRSYIRCALHK